MWRCGSIGGLQIGQRPIDRFRVTIFKQRQIGPVLAVFRDRRWIDRNLIAQRSGIKITAGGVIHCEHEVQRMLGEAAPRCAVRGSAVVRDLR